MPSNVHATFSVSLPPSIYNEELPHPGPVGVYRPAREAEGERERPSRTRYPCWRGGCTVVEGLHPTATGDGQEGLGTAHSKTGCVFSQQKLFVPPLPPLGKKKKKVMEERKILG